MRALALEKPNEGSIATRGWERGGEGCARSADDEKRARHTARDAANGLLLAAKRDLALQLYGVADRGHIV